MRAVKLVFFVLVVSVAFKVASICTSSTSFRDGDLIFQSELLPRAVAIQAATFSKYNHVGIIFKERGEYYVYEAIGKVTKTPLDSFINRRGTYGRYAVMRPRSDFNTRSLKSHVVSQVGKNYDPSFKWSDDRMYCSELIWKAYYNSNSIEIASPWPIEDRVAGKILLPLIPSKYIRPLDTNDPVVSPADLARSWKLKLIYTNY